MLITNDYRPVTVEHAAEVLCNGNKAKLAQILCVHRSTVAGWENPERRKKGLCGVIPEQYLPKVFQLIADMRDASGEKP